MRPFDALGLSVIEASTLDEAQQRLAEHEPPIVILDASFKHPEQCIMLTQYVVSQRKPTAVDRRHGSSFKNVPGSSLITQ